MKVKEPIKQLEQYDPEARVYSDCWMGKGIGSLLVVKRTSVVLINSIIRRAYRIAADGDGLSLGLCHPLHLGLLDNDGILANEDGHQPLRCEERLPLAAIDALSGPEVHPLAAWEIDGTRQGAFVGDGTDHHRMSEHELITHPIGHLVVLPIVKHRCHHGARSLHHLPRIAIQIWYQRVAQRVVGGEYALRLLAVGPRLMIARMIHTEEHRHGAEHAELAPAQIKVGIVGGILFETAHAMRPIAYARQGHRKASTDYRFEPLPFGAPVACPNEGITLDARIAFACMSKTTHPVLFNESLIRSRTIGQGEKVVEFGTRKAFVNNAIGATWIAGITSSLRVMNDE